MENCAPNSTVAPANPIRPMGRVEMWLPLLVGMNCGGLEGKDPKSRFDWLGLVGYTSGVRASWLP